MKFINKYVLSYSLLWDFNSEFSEVAQIDKLSKDCKPHYDINKRDE